MNAILSSSVLILLRIRCRATVSKNFSKFSLFPEKGVIFPPFMTSLIAAFEVLLIVTGWVVGSGVGVVGFFVSSSAWKSCSAGALNSGVV